MYLMCQVQSSPHAHFVVRDKADQSKMSEIPMYTTSLELYRSILALVRNVLG